MAGRDGMGFTPAIEAVGPVSTGAPLTLRVRLVSSDPAQPTARTLVEVQVVCPEIAFEPSPDFPSDDRPSTTRRAIRVGDPVIPPRIDLAGRVLATALGPFLVRAIFFHRNNLIGTARITLDPGTGPGHDAATG